MFVRTNSWYVETLRFELYQDCIGEQSVRQVLKFMYIAWLFIAKIAKCEEVAELSGNYDDNSVPPGLS